MEKQSTALKIDANDMHFRASVSNINEEARTFDVTFATETPVKKMDWSRYVYVDEVLEISEAAIDATRIGGDSSIPFLDNHNSWGGSRSILGVIEGWEIKGKKAKATVRMSQRDTVVGNDPIAGIWHDIKTGIIRSVSVGYTVEQYEKTMAKENSGKRDVYRATRWTPMEISTANIPADQNATLGRTEGKENNPTEPAKFVEVPVFMRTAAIESPEKASATPAPPPVVENRSKMDEKELAAENAENATLQQRLKEAEAKALKLERDNEVRTICDQFGFDGTRTAEFLNSKASAEEVRKSAIELHFKADPSKGAPGGANVIGRVGPELTERMTDAILLRSASVAEQTMTPNQVEAAREFRGLSLIEMGREIMHEHGISTARMDSETILKNVMGTGSVRNAMVTTDFTNILGNAINRTLRAAYQLAPQEWKKFSRKSNAKDFRPMTRINIGDAPRLLKIQENAEIQRGALKDGKETYSIDHYGRIVELSWKAMINDDLDAFGRLPQAMAEEVAQTHSDIVWDMILANPTMDDGSQVFATAHGNIAASGTALDVTNLSAARLAMRNQKSVGTPTTAGRFLNIEGKYLVVGPELETAAYQLINATIVPETVGTANPFKGMFEVVVDPRITDKSWYIMAAPGRVDGIEYALLNGKEFWTEQDRNFDTSGYAWKIETAFGATILDHRGLYLNEGV